MTLGDLLVSLSKLAQENPNLINRPIFMDDGDRILGAVNRVESAYSSRDDDISGEKLSPDDPRDKYLVTVLVES